jgi:hypothetical protein
MEKGFCIDGSEEEKEEQEKEVRYHQFSMWRNRARILFIATANRSYH